MNAAVAAAAPAPQRNPFHRSPVVDDKGFARPAPKRSTSDAVTGGAKWGALSLTTTLRPVSASLLSPTGGRKVARSASQLTASQPSASQALKQQTIAFGRPSTGGLDLNESGSIVSASQADELGSQMGLTLSKPSLVRSTSLESSQLDTLCMSQLQLGTQTQCLPTQPLTPLGM
jgi:hypothetical protein